MSSGEGTIVLGLVVAPVAAAAVVAVALPVAAVYGAVKGGQALHEAHQRKAAERRRVADAAEVARLREQFDDALLRRAALNADAALLEVSVPELSWDDDAGVVEARNLVDGTWSAMDRLEDDLASARAELARQRARLDAERQRRTALDQQATRLRVGPAEPLLTGSDDRPSSARASADAARRANDAYAARLDEQESRLSGLLTDLAREQGRLTRRHRAAEDSGADIEAQPVQGYPDLSLVDEAEHQLAEVRAAAGGAKALLDARLRAKAADHAKAVTSAIRPLWDPAAPETGDEPWRIAARAELGRALASSGTGAGRMPEVAEAIAALEVAGDEREAVRAAAAAVASLEAESMRRGRVEAVAAAAAELAEEAQLIRSADLASRCVALAEEARTSTSAWSDARLSEVQSVQLPALRNEIAEYRAEEARQAERRRARRVAQAAARAVAGVRRAIEDSSSWQIIELQRPDHLIAPDVYVDGFLARQVGDLSSAILVRATEAGGVQVLHMAMNTGEGPAVAADQDRACAEISSLLITRIEPLIQATLGDEFSFSLDVDLTRRGTYRPTARELAQMHQLDASIEDVEGFQALKSMGIGS